LRHNKIEDLQNLYSLQFLVDLEELDLKDNPIQNNPKYNETIKEVISSNKIIYEFSYKPSSCNNENMSVNSSSNNLQLMKKTISWLMETYLKN